MSLASEPRRGQIDLTNCDKEPIHLAGSIQPHGCLLAFELAGLTLQYHSANAAEWFDSELAVGSPLEELFDEVSIRRLRDSTQQPEGVIRLLSLARRGESRNNSHLGSVHVSQGMLILELEFQPTTAPTEEQQNLGLSLKVNLVNQRLQRCTDLDELYTVITEEMRSLSGFDRVMLYRFSEDHHGEVIGEAVREDLEPFLGLHYPASDIPEQARRLYVLNTVRSIGDVSAVPVPIVPHCDSLSADPLDLSYCHFRAVSPIHIEYLQNMGVQASMSISIVRNRKLWGLIACHHYAPKPLRLEERAACEILGLLVANYLAAMETQEISSERDVRRKHYHEVLEAVSEPRRLIDALETLAPRLQQIVDSNGVAICTQQGVRLVGSTPTVEQIERILRHLHANEADKDLWITRSLSRSIAGWQSTTSASGCLALPLLGPDSQWLLFFRDEYIREVSWAGNPEKAVVEADEGVRLSPRKSFAEWREKVREQSRPWSQVDREMAAELRSGMLELLSLRAAELVRVNEELMSINSDLDSFAYAASHDLREPLRGIQQIVFLLRQELGHTITDAIEGRLAALVRLASRMDELVQGLLRLSRVGRGDLEIERFEWEEVARDAVEMVVGHPLPADITVNIHGSAALHADYLCIRELLTNLVTNALKYNKNAHKLIEMGVQKNTSAEGFSETVFFVKDNGIGIAPEHHTDVFQIFRRLHLPQDFGGGSGAGLTICQKIVGRHGGRIWIESEEGSGSIFLFTLGE